MDFIHLIMQASTYQHYVSLPVNNFSTGINAVITVIKNF